MIAWVSAANVVSYYAINTNGANPLDLASGTLSVKKEDDSTEAWNAAVSTTPGADPVTGNDPA